MGATTLALMNDSGADPHAAIEFYGSEVLPKLGAGLSVQPGDAASREASA
jgi:hypothetical protein